MKRDREVRLYSKEWVENLVLDALCEEVIGQGVYLDEPPPLQACPQCKEAPLRLHVEEITDVQPASTEWCRHAACGTWFCKDCVEGGAPGTDEDRLWTCPTCETTGNSPASVPISSLIHASTTGIKGRCITGEPSLRVRKTTDPKVAAPTTRTAGKQHASSKRAEPRKEAANKPRRTRSPPLVDQLKESADAARAQDLVATGLGTSARSPVAMGVATGSVFLHGGPITKVDSLTGKATGIPQYAIDDDSARRIWDTAKYGVGRDEPSTLPPDEAFSPLTPVPSAGFVTAAALIKRRAKGVATEAEGQ